jgi:hypothetical protein
MVFDGEENYDIEGYQITNYKYQITKSKYQSTIPILHHFSFSQLTYT